MSLQQHYQDTLLQVSKLEEDISKLSTQLETEAHVGIKVLESVSNQINSSEDMKPSRMSVCMWLYLHKVIFEQSIGHFILDAIVIQYVHVLVCNNFKLIRIYSVQLR